MKIDFHTHGKLAKFLPFSKEYMLWQFREARRAGLDAICLTEHYNSNELSMLYEYLNGALERDGDCYIFDGLKIFAGLEIDISEGGHILTIGNADDIAAIYTDLAPYLRKNAHPAFKELLEIIKPRPILIGAGHPLRKGGHIPQLPEELLTQLDFIEMNGKDAALGGDDIKKRTNALAARLGLPVLAGSDTHQSIQFGCIYTSFDGDFATINALKPAIAQNRYGIAFSEFALAQVVNAKLVNRALKEINALGGDYVSVLIED
jgi:hypothetical protein